MTNAFVNGIIPVIEPTDEEIDDVLATLGMTRESICCAYCGDTYTEWDHFRPLIKDKEPTGYISLTALSPLITWTNVIQAISNAVFILFLRILL